MWVRQTPLKGKQKAASHIVWEFQLNKLITLHHSEIHFLLKKVKVEAKIFKMDKPSELKA